MPFSRILLFFLFFGLVSPLFAAAVHHPAGGEFLVELYDQLHASPAQTRFRTIAPIPVGAVYVQHPAEGEAEMRLHFRNMKRLGFNALKQVMPATGWTLEQIQLIALEEGMIPWWYGEGGWEPPSPELLERLGLPAATPMAELRTHPRWLEHQKQVMRNRILRAAEYRKQGKRILDGSVAFVREVGGVGIDLTEEAKPLFLAWVKNRYQTIGQLNLAYNQQHAGLTPGEALPFQSWEDYETRWQNQNPREYGHIRDIFRFKAESRLEYTRRRITEYRQFDPLAPFRGGGEMSLFLPAAYWGVNMERIADLMTPEGSFYPSIHLSWHFHQVNHEIVRPVYMQASMATDIFKGGWSASWESTGGPQQFDGGKEGNGFTVDGGTMTQLMLSYLGAGFKGFGFWCWSPRSAGKEAGEYSLLDRNNQITERALRVGQIGQAAQKFRDELWQAHKEPLVGVFADWEHEAVWGVMSVGGREEFRQWPISARIGVSRALINANVPFEYVTGTDLRKGLAPRYKIIYLPFCISLPADLLKILTGYVDKGGRLVIDLPSAWYDENLALLPTGKGSAFENLFGVALHDFQYAGVNRPTRLEGLTLAGFTLDMESTHAKILARYDNGKPAVTEAALGQGKAVLLGCEASMLCFKPGNTLAESLLLKYSLGTLQPAFTCPEAIVYRLSSPQADHYFLINDAPARTARLTVAQYPYREAEDAWTGEKISLDSSIALEAFSGRWLRCAK